MCAKHVPGEAITCLVNPLAGREAELDLAEQKKKVVVVGGGPGGLYAAYVCALLGHDVTLYEEKRDAWRKYASGSLSPREKDVLMA